MDTIIIVESPFAANLEHSQAEHEAYAKECCLQVIDDGDTPYASHLFFPQFLDESDPADRDLGIRLGYQVAKALFNAPYTQVTVAFFIDMGWSPGMLAALEEYSGGGVRYEVRRLKDREPAKLSTE